MVSQRLLTTKDNIVWNTKICSILNPLVLAGCACHHGLCLSGDPQNKYSYTGLKLGCNTPNIFSLVFVS